MGMGVSAWDMPEHGHACLGQKNVRCSPHLVQEALLHLITMQTVVKMRLLCRPLCCLCPEASLHKAWCIFLVEMRVYPWGNRAFLN